MDDKQERLNELLDRWEDGMERGAPPSLDDLCRNHPELKEEVARQVTALQAMDAKLRGPSQPLSDHGLPARLSAASDFDELAFHAKGGLGVVCTAFERQVHRIVAVKFLRPDIAGDPESIRQFGLEAEITGRLEHPGIVPLYGIGHDPRGNAFYYMRFIDGATLDEAIGAFHAEHGPLDFDRAQDVEFRALLMNFVSICKTIAYAHNRGIVHRDIKPQNVMLGRYGETIVVDWGLAIPVDRDERFRVPGEGTLRLSLARGGGSSSGRGTGTPAYMSPEQMAGLEPAPASDIYSLGATLYKLFTGAPPFAGGTSHEIRRNVMEGKFPKPLESQPGGSPILQAICLKAMEHKAKDRYLTALELASDIENYLADAPVSAMPDSWLQGIARWARSHWQLTQTAIVLLAVAAVLSWISSAWFGTMARQQQIARKQTEILRTAAEGARRSNLQTSAAFLARSIAYEIDLRWRILEAEANSNQLREQMQRINAEPADRELWKPPQSWLEKRFIAHTSAIRCASWFVNSRDGTQIARVPEVGKIGQNFAHRDYFHGQGIELQPEQLQGKTILPMSQPVHMSAVFESTITHTLMVAFSTPIWDQPPEALERTSVGVLSMAVELGDFATGEDVILADTRRDSLSNSAGLVLHHAKLGLRSKKDLPPRLDPQTLEFARQLRLSRAQVRGLAGSAGVSLRESFIDPVTKEQVLAAMEPVFVLGREKSIADSGWVVVVTEHHE